jgi:hypothetical protein
MSDRKRPLFDTLAGGHRSKDGDQARVRVSRRGESAAFSGGLGLHFPKLDADLYLPALLDGWLGSRRWMAARMGERGGRARSAAKRTASRANGKLGGRPRKAARG